MVATQCNNDDRCNSKNQCRLINQNLLMTLFGISMESMERDGESIALERTNIMHSLPSRAR